MTASMDAVDEVLVPMFRRGELCCVYIDGAWRPPSEGQPWAFVGYTEEPTPDTGHVGWIWWAQGKMGDAPSFAAAREMAERTLRRMPILHCGDKPDWLAALEAMWGKW